MTEIGKTTPAITRRQLGAAAAGLASGLAALAAGSAARAAEEAHGDAAHQADMRNLPKLKFALLLFPNVTALDLVAPQLIMATMMNTEVHLVAKTRAPVMADSGFAMVPTTDFA